MKKVLIGAMILLAGPALAEGLDIVEQANGMIQALEAQRNSALNEVVQLRAALAKVQRELSEAKAAAPKKDETPASKKD